MSHVIAGISVTLAGDIALPEQIDQMVARCEDPTEMTIRLTAARAAPPFRPAGQATVEFDSWAAFVDGDTVQICAKLPTRATPEVMRIELARDGFEGRYLHEDGWPYVFQYPYDQLLVVHALRIAGGALIHGASIAGRDGAVLVAGPSGAGKTTMARAAAAFGARVLSDERTIVRPVAGGGWIAGGTPWPGEGGFAENRSVPLRAVILLEQSDRDELMPLSPARALGLLYRCHFLPLWDPRACERTVDNLERLVSALPVYLFRNRKGPEAARRLLELVGGAQ